MDEIQDYQIPTGEKEAMDDVKLEFEETEPKKIDEVDPATMERIKYFNEARLRKFGIKTFELVGDRLEEVYRRAA